MDNFPLMNIKKWNDLKDVLVTRFLNLLDPIANDKFPVISTSNTLRHSSKIVSKLFLNYAPSIKPFSWFSQIDSYDKFPKITGLTPMGNTKKHTPLSVPILLTWLM